MTHYTDADLEIADLHILEGGRRVLQQEEVLASLRLFGLPTVEAEKLLGLFKDTLVAFRDHRDAIAAAIERDHAR